MDRVSRRPAIARGTQCRQHRLRRDRETPPVFAQAAGADLLYVAYEPPAPTSEAILLPKDSPIRSVAELKGRKVALNKGSNALPVGPRPRAGRPEVQRHPTVTCRRPTPAPPSSATASTPAIWDPYQAAAEKQLSARVLVDGRELVDNHQFYLATRTYAQRHPQVLDKLVDEIRQVGDWSRANPQQVTEQVAPLLGLPADTPDRGEAPGLRRAVDHPGGGRGAAEDRRHLHPAEADSQTAEHQGRDLDAAGRQGRQRP